MNPLNTDLSDIGFFKKRFNKKDIAFICRQLAYILNSGLNMSFGLDVLIDNALDSRMRKCFYVMKQDLMKGLRICVCFRKAGVFPDFLINMINIGEKTDSLGVIMKDMADFYDKDAKLASEISAAILYPVFVAVSMVVVVIAALVFVVPNYAVMFIDAGETLPLPTRILIAMSDFFLINWQWILIFIFAAILGGILFFNTVRGGYVKDWLKLKIILAGKYNAKSMNLYFSRSMSVLLSSRADIVSSLCVAKDILNNAVCSRRIDMMIEKIRSGSTLSRALSDSDLFDKMLFSMAKLGEETDRLPDALNECAKYLEEELTAVTNRMKELIQPVSTIFLGLVLAFIVIATMLPTIQVTSFF